MRSASSRKVTTIKKRPTAGRYLFRARSAPLSGGGAPRCRLSAPQAPKAPENSRLDGVRQCVQKVLNLVGLLPELIERAWVVRGAIVPSSVTKGALVSQMVARCAPYLRHYC